MAIPTSGKKAMTLLATAALLMVVTVGPRAAEAASEACADLVPSLLEACPPFEFARENNIDLVVEPNKSADDGETPQVMAQAGPPMVTAFDDIGDATFDDACCELIAEVNSSRCFCEEDVVAALQSEMNDELLAFTIFSAAQPIPEGCGGAIFSSLDGEGCLPLGPMSDDIDDEEDCIRISTELRSPNLLNGSFILLREALDASGLIDDLSQLRKFTLFAPTDEAFEAFAEGRNLSSSDLLGDVLLGDILLRHVIDETIETKDIKRDINVTTLQGSSVTISKGQDDVINVEDSPLIRKDLLTCRGVIHTIGKVLWPPKDFDELSRIEEISNSSNITGKLNETENCTDGGETILQVLSDFEEDFGILIEEIETSEDIQEILDGDEPMTVFAPINTALQLNQTDDAKDIQENVETILKRHIVPGDISASQLIPGTKLFSIEEDELVISSVGGRLLINDVPIVQVDILACNGRIHVVEDVLPSLSNPDETEAKNSSTSGSQDEEVTLEEDDIVPQRPNNTRGANNREDKSGAMEEDKTDAMKEDKTDAMKEDKTDAMKEDNDGSIKEDKEVSRNDSDSCLCSEDGVSGGTETGRPGCAQHILNFDNNFLFCYVNDPKACNRTSNNSISESTRFKGAGWRECSLEEATDLPNLKQLISKDVESLRSVWRLFDRAGIADTLKGDSPLTVFVPSDLAVSRAIVTRILNDTTTNGRKELITIAENHIVRGNLTADELSQIIENGNKSVTTLAGTELKLKEDEDGAIIIGSNSRVSLGDLYASNGIAHIVDDLILDGVIDDAPRVPLRDACECSQDGVSGDIETGRRGCKQHIPDNPAFCYVQDPENCRVGTPSKAFPGAKFMSCADPCRCALNGVSGNVVTGRPGCARHVLDVGAFCYVAEPNKCKRATPSEKFPGAGWRWCSSMSNGVTLAFLSPDTGEDPCECSEDGVSGGVSTGRRGCGRFGILLAPFNICYVKDPSRCLTAVPSLRTGGAAWRPC